MQRCSFNICVINVSFLYLFDFFEEKKIECAAVLKIYKYGNDHKMTYIRALDYVCSQPKSPNLFSPYLGHFCVGFHSNFSPHRISLKLVSANLIIS